MISVENALSEERFVLELPTSRAMLTTVRPSCLCLFILYVLCVYMYVIVIGQV